MGTDKKKSKLQAIEQRCWTRYNELLNETFGEMGRMAAYEKPQTLDERFAPSLPESLGKEYRAFLEEVWKEFRPEGAKAFNELMDAEKIIEGAEAKYGEDLRRTREEAIKVSAWEKVTSSNHKDVIAYVGLLKDCTEDMLKALLEDFLHDVVEYFPEIDITEEVI